MIQKIITKLLDGKQLARAEARAVMGEIMRGEATPAQIGGFLVALLQAGAGIVADSDPVAEHRECLNKLAALEAAIELAEAT